MKTSNAARDARIIATSTPAQLVKHWWGIAARRADFFANGVSASYQARAALLAALDAQRVAVETRLAELGYETIGTGETVRFEKRAA